MEFMHRIRISLNTLWKVSNRSLNLYRRKTIFYSTLHPVNKNFLFVPSQISNDAFYSKRAQKMSKGGKPKIIKLTDEELSEVIDVEEFRYQLLAVNEKLKKDYVDNLSIRSSSNIENIVVKVDNEEYPLHELAQISRKGQNLVAINMSDFPEALKPAIQAIIESGGGFNPQQEGTMIYLTIPKMTREHRENLAKNAKSLFVKTKEEIRSIQNSFIKLAKQRTELSEDLVFNTSNQIMSIADQSLIEIEKTFKSKQKELLNEN